MVRYPSGGRGRAPLNLPASKRGTYLSRREDGNCVLQAVCRVVPVSYPPAVRVSSSGEMAGDVNRGISGQASRKAHLRRAIHGRLAS